MYLDTAILSKLFFPEPESDIVQKIVEKQAELYSSELLITEFYSVTARKLREGKLTSKVAKEIVDAFHDLETESLELLPITKKELKNSGEIILRLKEQVPLRSLDAIHITTCLSYNLFPLFTNDKIMLKAAKTLDIPTQRLDYSPKTIL